jgi:signal transduction histidine kinase
MLEIIFKPFVRVEGDTMASASNGLGLAIAAGAIHLHRGSIVAANRLGGGLEVVVRLPLDTTEKEESAMI